MRRPLRALQAWFGDRKASQGLPWGVRNLKSGRRERRNRVGFSYAPEKPEKYQVLDGHHRLVILRDLGHTEIRCDVWDVDDREAKLLLATLNRLEGSDLPIRRAQLVHELLGEMNVDDLAGLLPESGRQLEELHSLLEFPADEVASLLEEQAEEEEKVLPRVMSFVVTPEQEELIEQAVELASDGTPGRDRRARGLANLARLYMERRGDEQVTPEGP